MDYYTTGIEARQRYDEMLQQAEEKRKVGRITSQVSRPRSVLIVRAGDILVSMGQWLRGQDSMTYAYDKR